MTKAAPLFRSCLFGIFISSKFLRSGKRKSLYGAVRNTFAAADTVVVIAFFYGIESHGAGSPAGSAIRAGFLIKFYPDKSDLIE